MKDIFLFLTLGILFLVLAFLMEQPIMFIITVIVCIACFIIHILLALSYLNKQQYK